MKNNMKSLNTQEINDIIEGIENGEIIIDSRNAPKMTKEEIKFYKELRLERFNAMSDDEKESLRLFVEKLRKEDNEK